MEQWSKADARWFRNDPRTLLRYHARGEWAQLLPSADSRGGGGLAAPQPVAKLARATFLGFFVIYTAGSIAWLLSGLPPVLAAQVPSVHATLHQWGAGNRAYLVASKKGLEQQATAGGH